jgi:CHAT domain-containing protein
VNPSQHNPAELPGLSAAELEEFSPTEILALSQIADLGQRRAQAAEWRAHKNAQLAEILGTLRDMKADAKANWMQSLAVEQQETTTALLALFAGGDRPPNEAFDRYLGLARRLVADVADFEREWRGSFDVAGYAQQLVQWLSIYADHRQDDGDAELAKQLRQEADELTVTYLGPSAAAKVHRDRAMQAAMEGRFNEALSGLDDVRTTFADAGMMLDKVQTDLQIASIYEWLGDYKRALDTLEAAHDEVEPRMPAGRPSTAQVRSAIADQLVEMMQGGNTREGEDLLALQRIAYEVVQGEARNNRWLGRYDEAERLFLEARPFVAGDLGVPAGIDFHLAVIAVARGDTATAQPLLASIAPAFESGMFRPRRGALRQVQADLHLLLNEPEQALAAADDGLSDQATYPDLEFAWKLQWRRARALSALGRHREAIDAFREGMSKADQLRMAPMGYRLDTTFVRDKLPMAHDAVSAALAAGDASAVAWFIELIKSRALTATISQPRAPNTSRTPREVQFDELSQRIDSLAFIHYRASEDSVLEKRRDLLDQRNTLLEQIRLRDPRWRTMTEPPQVDLDAIRERLGPSRAALVLQHRTDGKTDRIVAALIHKADVVAAAHDLDPETMAAIRKFAKNLRKTSPTERVIDISTDAGVGLEQLLPPKVLEQLGAFETLIIVPHDVLHLLPWACLTVGPQRLFQRCAVGILPNLASLPLLDDEPATDLTVALLGAADYSGLRTYSVLTESPFEIEDVAALCGKYVVGDPVTGRDATEAAFWALAESAWPEARLHYSGHGNLDAIEPLASGLVLTESSVDAAEVLEHRLPYVEVVLSACSTAWRPQSTRDIKAKRDVEPPPGFELSGDDALGLPASFLEAGARFLLASIPPVRDKMARAFTVAWHRYRLSGLSPLLAYQKVQQDLLAGQPGLLFAWAGMTAYGCR